MAYCLSEYNFIDWTKALTARPLHSRPALVCAQQMCKAQCTDYKYYGTQKRKHVRPGFLLATTACTFCQLLCVFLAWPCCWLCAVLVPNK